MTWYIEKYLAFPQRQWKQNIFPVGKRIMTSMVEASILKCMSSKQSKTHFSPSKVARSPNHYSKN